MENETDFTEGSIPGKLLRFMLPILAALVLQAMYGAVDVLVVGQFGTTAGISGVSTGSNIVNLIVFSITSLSTGITVLIGRYIGEKKTDRIGKVIGGVICFFVVLAVVLALIMLMLTRPIAILMQAPEEALELTMIYVRICGGGIIFIIAYNVISSVFRGLGNSRLPLIFVAIACVVNIAGDLIFVGVFRWNVVGAALATVMAQAVSVILSLVILSRQKLPFTIKRSDICFNEEIGKFLRLGAPLAFQEIMTQLSFLAFCAFINRLGVDASAGYGVASRINSFIMLVPSSLMQSMASFVSQNVGAGKEERAVRGTRIGIIAGCCIGVCVMLLIIFEGDLLSGIFTQDPAVIACAADYLKGISLEAVVTSISFGFIGYYNGHGETVFVMIQGMCQCFLVRLPMSYFMSIQPNASLFWIGVAAPCATIFGILLELGYLFLIFRPKQRRLAEKKPASQT